MTGNLVIVGCSIALVVLVGSGRMSLLTGMFLTAAVMIAVFFAHWQWGLELGFLGKFSRVTSAVKAGVFFSLLPYWALWVADYYRGRIYVR